MAVRERKGRAKPYQVYWNNPFTGKRESKSFTTREEALKEDSLVTYRLKNDRESFQKCGTEEKEQQKISFEQAFFAFLRKKQFCRKSLVWQVYCMRAALVEFGQKPVSELDRQDLESVMQRLDNGKSKPITIRIRMCALRAVLNWAAEQGMCSKLVFPKLPPKHYEQFIPPTLEEVEKILQVAPPHIQRIILLGTQCGARVGPSEMFNLKWADVSFSKQLLIIHGSKKNPGSLWRQIPLKDFFCEILLAWYHEDSAENLEWIIHFRKKPVSCIKNSWRTTLLKAGISRRIRPYDLRHAFATELIAAGADIGTVANMGPQQR